MKLVDLNQTDFDKYLKRAISDYAKDKVKAGNFPEKNALELSRTGYEKLLPEGLQTKDHQFFSIFDDANNRKIGIIWIKLNLENGIREVWLYDFLIFEEFRRQGFGRRSLELLDKKAEELNADKVSLHVFGHNTAAISLYEKSGFQTTNINMAKFLK